MFAILGGETDESMATATMKTYDVENEEWITQPEMAQNRKDHACLVIEIDGNRGECGRIGMDRREFFFTSLY